MTNSKLNAVILAAGKGTRMKSDQAKVLHEVFFAPMVHHVLDAVMPLAPATTVMVVGHQRQAVQDALAGYDVSCAVQTEQLGTGHAVLAAREMLAGGESSVLILCGDTPLIRSDTLRAMLDAHRSSGAALTVMSTEVDDPQGYGRMVKSADGAVQRIVEEKDATAEQRMIREINAGIYLVESDFLFSALDKVGTDNVQGEMYLTDIVGIAVGAGVKARIFRCTDPEETLGVNSRGELAVAHARLQERRNRELMAAGATLVQPSTISIGKGVMIGRDTVIEPNVRILGTSRVGAECRLGPCCEIRDCRIGDRVHVGPFSFLEGCLIKDGQEVAPGSVVRSPELAGGSG